MNWNGSVVWITGASSGIGEEFAIQAAQKGAKVILSARNEAKLREVQEKLSNKENHLVLPMDLEKSNFHALVKHVVDVYGRIDLLVNNGGVSQRSLVVDTDMEIDRKIMEVNYFGTIALTKAVLPVMISQNSGHIVAMSSIAGKFGFFLRSSYSASKHALFGFFESLLLEVEPFNISITIATPGKINTSISMHALDGKGRAHGIMDHNQRTGLSVEQCVQRIMSGIDRKQKEVLIGKKELIAVYLKRFLPSIFWKVIRKQSAT